MPEYRYTGVNVNGRPVQGVVFSPDGKAVKNRLGKITRTKGLRIDAVEKKSLFVYKVQRGAEKPITGEQKAFNKDELRAALTKMGYRVIYVRKKLLDVKLGVPTKDLILFIRISADLLREQFPYDEILSLVGNDTGNRRLRETLRDVQKDLKAGNDGQNVYAKHQDVFGKFTAHMLAVASTSGNMAAIYESTAKFLERDAEFKSNLRSILVMPIAVVVAMLGAMIFYVMYIFPKMTDMLTKYEVDIPPMTKATLQVSDFLQDYWSLLAVAVAAPIVFFTSWMRTEKGRYFIDQTLLNIPVIGSLLQRISIEIFCRVFYALYSGSSENITAIRIAAESCRNKFIEKQITGLVLPRMLKEGKSFVECLSRANCFTVTALRRLKSGEESGTLRESALQLANYYEKETKHKMSRLMDVINLIVSILITVLIIGLTLVSTEIGFVNPPSPLSR